MDKMMLDRWPGRDSQALFYREGQAQEFLLEVVNFVDDAGEFVVSACLAIDGECGGYMGEYCGGCGGCIIMQAIHGGYTLQRVYEPMLVTHRMAWDDALAALERLLDEEERMAAEAVALMEGRGPFTRMTRISSAAAFYREYGGEP